MAPKLYPCICGTETETYSQMCLHRRECETWKNRPDPKALANLRRASNNGGRSPGNRCPHCGRRPDHHQKDCPNSFEERSRLNILKRHGVDPDLFAKILKVLAKRYSDNDKDE